MKKMFMILMMAFTMMAGLFAYEPNKENLTIKRNKIIYYEKTEPYYFCWLHVSDYKKDYRKWVISKSYSVEQLANHYFSRLDVNRGPHIYDKFVIAGREASVNYIPFVTEENWLTITEEELCEKLKDFIK